MRMEVAKTGTGSRTQRRAASKNIASSRCCISVRSSIGIESIGINNTASGNPKQMTNFINSVEFIFRIGKRPFLNRVRLSRLIYNHHRVLDQRKSFSMLLKFLPRICFWSKKSPDKISRRCSHFMIYALCAYGVPITVGSLCCMDSSK